MVTCSNVKGLLQLSMANSPRRDCKWLQGSSFTQLLAGQPRRLFDVATYRHISKALIKGPFAVF